MTHGRNDASDPPATSSEIAGSAMQHAATLAPLTARRSRPLTGRVRVPGDKSISVRSLILGALAVGETRIAGMLEGADAISSANAMAALGATVERTGEQAWRIMGVGVSGFAEPRAPLDFGNSGTGCRLAMGAVAGCPITAVFDGDAARGPCRARHHHRGGERGEPRPYRAHAAAFRGAGRGRAAWLPWPADHAHRPAGACGRA